MERNYKPIVEIQIGFAYFIARKLTFTEPIFIAKLLANPSSDFLHHTRSDWLPCHPSHTIGGIRDRRFQFLLYGQTSGQECVLQRATSAIEDDMRRRPSRSIRCMPHCRRLFSACFSAAAPCEKSKQGLTPT
jgi:hypothetical protein